VSLLTTKLSTIYLLVVGATQFSVSRD